MCVKYVPELQAHAIKLHSSLEETRYHMMNLYCLLGVVIHECQISESQQ